MHINKNMATSGEEIEDEILLLESIYTHELTEVAKSENGRVEEVVLKLEPATGDDHDKKYVCLTLHLALPAQYPDEAPGVSIKNPRGLAEEHISELIIELRNAAEERRGQCMLFDLIELAKESLTQSNVPHGDCVICMIHFDPSDVFIKTRCYHYFHTQCLLRYVLHEEMELAREAEEHKRTNSHKTLEAKKVGCPVCRCELGITAEELTVASPSIRDEPFSFKPDRALLEQQARMKKIFERQRARGGHIDLEEERNKYLLSNASQVITQPAKSDTTKQSSETETNQSSDQSSSQPSTHTNNQPPNERYIKSGRGRGKPRDHRNDRRPDPRNHRDKQHETNSNHRHGDDRYRNNDKYERRDHNHRHRENNRRHREDGYERYTNDSQNRFPHPRRDKKEREAKRSEGTKSDKQPKGNREHGAKSRENNKSKDEALEKSRTCEVQDKRIKPLCDNQPESDSQFGTKPDSHKAAKCYESKESGSEKESKEIGNKPTHSTDSDRTKDKPTNHRFTFKSKSQISPREDDSNSVDNANEDSHEDMKSDNQHRLSGRGRGRGFKSHPRQDENDSYKRNTLTGPGRPDHQNDKDNHKSKRPDVERYDSRAKHAHIPDKQGANQSRPNPRGYRNYESSYKERTNEKTVHRHADRSKTDNIKSDDVTCKHSETTKSKSDDTSSLGSIAQSLGHHQKESYDLKLNKAKRDNTDPRKEKRAPPGFANSGPPPGFKGHAAPVVSAPPGFS